MSIKVVTTLSPLPPPRSSKVGMLGKFKWEYQEVWKGRVFWAEMDNTDMVEEAFQSNEKWCIMHLGPGNQRLIDVVGYEQYRQRQEEDESWTTIYTRKVRRVFVHIEGVMSDC